LNRQKSSVSVNSNSGGFSSRLMTGTVSSNVKKQSSKIYNERMLSRAGSVNSTNSIGAGVRSGATRSILQNSEKQSLVRVALKNQKRNEKITVTTNPSIVSNSGAQDSRYQRLRVNSGVPFLRAGAGVTGTAIDFRNQRTSSNMSRGGGQ
jgi:hypothetical protein